MHVRLAAGVEIGNGEDGAVRRAAREGVVEGWDSIGVVDGNSLAGIEDGEACQLGAEGMEESKFVLFGEESLVILRRVTDTDKSRVGKSHVGRFAVKA
jgi:hypothetical protein